MDNGADRIAAVEARGVLQTVSLAWPVVRGASFAKPLTCDAGETKEVSQLSDAIEQFAAGASPRAGMSAASVVWRIGNTSS